MRSTDEISPIYFADNQEFIYYQDGSNTEENEGDHSNQNLRKNSEINITTEYQADQDENKIEEGRPQSNYQLRSYRKNKLVHGYKHKRILKSSYMSRRINSEQSTNNIDFHSNFICYSNSYFYLDEAKLVERNSSSKISDRNPPNFDNLETEGEQILPNEEHQSEENEIQLEIKEIHNPQSITSRQQMLNERKASTKAKNLNKNQWNLAVNAKDQIAQDESMEMKMYKKKVVEEELALLKAKNKISTIIYCI